MVEVSFTKDGRAIFTPFTEKTAKNPDTGKIGIRTHYAIIGFFLSLFGKAKKLHDDKSDTDFYVNINSTIDFLKFKGFKDTLNSSSRSELKLIAGIQDVIWLAKLNTRLCQTEDATSWAERAKIFASHGNPNQAADDYTQAICLTDQNDANQRANYLYWRAQCCKEVGSDQFLNLAVEDFSDLIKMGQRGDLPRQQRAELYERMGKLDLAIEDYIELLKGKTLESRSSYRLGLLYLKKGNQEEAIQAFCKAIDRNDFSPQVVGKFSIKDASLLELGKIYINQRAYEKALAELNKIEKIRKPNPEVARLIRQAAKLLTERNKK